MRYAVDPAVRGGLVVRVGDEVIDGSVGVPAAQASAARSRADTTDHRHDQLQTDETEDTLMAELTISADEIRSAIESYVSSYSPEASREEVGVVAETGDGIARVEGLPSAMTNELLEFEGGTLGIALNLDVRDIGVVILGDASKIEEGQEVKRTGEILSVPVGDAYLGRVVEPARPADRRPGRDRVRRAPRARAAGADRWCSARRSASRC